MKEDSKTTHCVHLAVLMGQQSTVSETPVKAMEIVAAVLELRHTRRRRYQVVCTDQLTTSQLSCVPVSSALKTHQCHQLIAVLGQRKTTSDCPPCQLSVGLDREAQHEPADCSSRRCLQVPPTMDSLSTTSTHVTWTSAVHTQPAGTDHHVQTSKVAD